MKKLVTLSLLAVAAVLIVRVVGIDSSTWPPWLQAIFPPPEPKKPVTVPQPVSKPYEPTPLVPLTAKQIAEQREAAAAAERAAAVANQRAEIIERRNALNARREAAAQATRDRIEASRVARELARAQEAQRAAEEEARRLTALPGTGGAATFGGA